MPKTTKTIDKTSTSTTIIGYKGFDKDLKCRGYQYEVGKTHKVKDASLCKYGLHFTENPLDVFGYYPPVDACGNLNRFAIVEAKGVTNEQSDDTKRVAKSLKITSEIGLPGLIKAGVEYTLSRSEDKEEATGNQSAATNTGDQSAATNTGNQSAATNTGNQSAATNTGYQSIATNTGYQSIATNTGNRSATTNTGDRSAATNTGYQSIATNTGYQSIATNTGNRSATTNTGDRSAATNTGYQSIATNTGYQSIATNTGNQSIATNTGNRSAATVSGKESVAISLGIEGKASGSLGCWLVLAEWEEGAVEWHRKSVQSVIVDGEIIKANTFYRLKDGAFVEVEDDQ